MISKVLIIGLDGATFDLIKPWVEQGELPTFKNLMKEGVYGDLNSTIPPLTPPAWTSLVTGKNPGKHNIFDFFKLKKNDYDRAIITSLDKRSESLWNILNKHNIKTGVLNLPFTYPPEKVNGFIVCGSESISVKSDFTYPKNLKKELLEKVKEYRQGLNWSYINKEDHDRFIKDLNLVTEKLEETSIYLIKKYKPEFFMVVFDDLDRLQHFFWRHMDKKHPMYDKEKSEKYKDAILNYYKKLDSVISNLIKFADKNTFIMILSDHGFGPIYKEVYINHYLKNLNLLKLKKEKELQKSLLKKLGITKEKLIYLSNSYKLNRIIKKIPYKLKVFLNSNINSSKLGDSSIDWFNTKAYFFSHSGRGIMINLKNRQINGIVSEGKEYDSIRDLIIDELKKIKDNSTGKRLIKNIFKREGIYKGPYIKNSPDLIVEMEEGYIAQEGMGKEPIMLSKQGSAYKSADHKINGIFIAKGPNIVKNKKIKNANILDVTPTLLYLLNIPISKDIDGKILKEIILNYSSRKVKYTKTHNPEEIKISSAIKNIDY